MKTEYKVVPAPEKARRKRGLKGVALFAHSVEELMNELAADGWQYLRADTLPQEERAGLTSKTTTYRNLLVFQRVIEDTPAQLIAPEAPPAPTPDPEDTPEAPEADDDVTNLWHTTDDGEDSGADTDADEGTRLVADRERQRVDL